MRKFGETKLGAKFSPAMVEAVWQKGKVVPGQDPKVRRKDACGAWIKRDSYGDVTPDGEGWEIDHMYPSALGGGDELENLQPLQWQNNRRKGDNWPDWSCAVEAVKG